MLQPCSQLSSGEAKAPRHSTGSKNGTRPTGESMAPVHAALSAVGVGSMPVHSNPSATQRGSAGRLAKPAGATSIERRTGDDAPLPPHEASSCSTHAPASSSSSAAAQSVELRSTSSHGLAAS